MVRPPPQAVEEAVEAEVGVDDERAADHPYANEVFDGEELETGFSLDKRDQLPSPVCMNEVVGVEPGVDDLSVTVRIDRDVELVLVRDGLLELGHHVADDVGGGVGGLADGHPSHERHALLANALGQDALQLEAGVGGGLAVGEHVAAEHVPGREEQCGTFRHAEFWYREQRRLISSIASTFPVKGILEAAFGQGLQVAEDGPA